MSENKCKCDLRTKLVGDGCRYCNPQDYIDHLHDAMVEREWQGLTYEDLPEQYKDDSVFVTGWLWAEAKLKEKNNG